MMLDDARARQWEQIARSVFAHLGLPQLEICAPESPRCVFFDLTSEFERAVRERTERDTLAGAFVPFTRWDVVGNHGPTARWGVAWAVGPSDPGKRRWLNWRFQIVFHSDQRVECDMDRFNPDGGLMPACAHFFGEVLPHRILRFATNPRKAMAGLVAAGVKQLEVSS